MLKLTSIIYLTLSLTSCEQASSNTNNNKQNLDSDIHRTSITITVPSDTTKPLKSKQMNKYYPFELQDFNGQHNIVAHIENEDLYPKYYDFFQKHGYEGNGYCWEGHIKQILEKLDKGLLTQIDFDPEAGAFFAIAKTKESQLKFVELLSPIFSEMKKLEEWVKKADRSRIDD
jgi:Immunity protein 51